MAIHGLGPIKFGTTSMVTATLGSNDPQVGTRVLEDGREYMLIYNACNSNLAVGNGVVLATGATGASCILSSVTSADILVGVVRHGTISTGYYGYVVTKGVSYIKMGATSGTVSAQGLCELAANGVFVPVSNTTGNKAPACAKALEDIVSSATGLAQIIGY